MTTSALCTFEGPVTQIRVIGGGRAVMFDNMAAFEHGNTASVELIGALQNATISNVDENLNPINLNPDCQDFDATYTAGKRIQVIVAKGGEPGKFFGKLADGPDCSTGCSVEWPAKKEFFLERKNDVLEQLAGPFPEGNPEKCTTTRTGYRLGVANVVFSAGKGSFLTCGDEKTPIEGDWLFLQDASQSLEVKQISVRGSTLEARIESKTVPLPKELRFPARAILAVPLPPPLPWPLVATGSAVVLVSAMGLVLWTRRKMQPRKLQPELRKDLHEALLDAFRSREKLAQLVRYGLDENLDEIAGQGNLRETVFQLLEHADANGYTKKLVEAARSENSGNEKLAAVAHKMGLS